MKYFTQLLPISLVSIALVGCSFNGRIPSSRATYPDVQAGGYSAIELLDMANHGPALTYKLQADSPNDPAYAEMRRRAFEDQRAIEVQVIGGHLMDAATCTAFKIGVEMITSPRQTAVQREVVRQAGYTALNGPSRGYLLVPPNYAFPSDCLDDARSKVPPPPGGWIARRS